MFFVRTASVRDAEKLRVLLHDTWHATFDDIYGADVINEVCEDWHNLDQIKKNIELRSGDYVVADNGEELGGMAFAQYTEEKGSAKLNQLYVAPHCQGQGVGADLVQEIEQCFPDVNKMILEVDQKNEAAIGFYNRVGYVQRSSADQCGGVNRDIPVFIFEKSLV